MQINSTAPVMTGSIEDMIAKLSLELEDQASEQRKASRQAEATRHETVLASIETQREAATTQMFVGLAGAGVSAVSACAGGTVSKALEIGAQVGNAVVGQYQANLNAQSSLQTEHAKTMEHARSQSDEGAQSASRFADKAVSHLSDIQRLIHESRMSAVRG